MESLCHIQTLKFIINLCHISGLAIGVGGAWILDIYILTNLKSTITKDKIQIISFISKFVSFGLMILWISGIAFIVYYYNYTPEYLYNEKVWAKGIIVTILSINGYLIHKIIFPKINKTKGGVFIDILNNRFEVVVIPAISFVSWIFPIALGIAGFLNFTIPWEEILSTYAISLIFFIIISDRVIYSLLKKTSKGYKYE